jgi:hypothetical protein
MTSLWKSGDKELITLLKEAEPLGMAKHLWKMNNEVVYVRDPGMVVAIRTGQKMDCSKFSAHSDWATQSVPERKIRPNGTFVIEKPAPPPSGSSGPCAEQLTN